MSLSYIFERGLHNLSNKDLIQLADSQQFLLSEVETSDLVYLVQELAFRLSDAVDDIPEAATPFHGSEHND